MFGSRAFPSPRDGGIHTLLCIVSLVSLVALSSAQVYLSGSGPIWSGACDNSCPQTGACQLSTSGSTTVSAPCILYFAGGMVIPGHTLSASFSGNLTLSSLGSVSLAADFSVTNTNGRVRMQNFKSDGGHKFTFTAARVSIDSATVTITDTSQIVIIGSSEVSVRDSYFTSSNPMLRCENLVAGTVIDLSGMNIQATQGIATTITSVFGNEPSIRIRNSRITGFMFSTSRLKDVTIENVVGTLTSASIFTTAPKTITMSDCRITSTGISWMSTTAGSTNTVSLTRNHFDNVVMRGSVTVSTYLEGCTFITDDVSYIVLDFSNGYGTSMTLTDVAVVTRTATGSAPLLSSFLYSTSNTGDNWYVSNLTYTSPSTVPRMKLTSGTYLHSSSESVIPSLQVNSATTTIHNTNNVLTHAGDITTTLSGTSTVYHGSNTAEVVFHSINIANNVVVQVMATVPIVRYHVTKPMQGIKCATIDCISNYNGLYYVTWDASLPLPTIGFSYPFIDGISTQPTFQPMNPDFLITDSFTSPIAYFTFQEVPCASNCVPANSGPCVSRSQCTCKPGWEGVNCECPTGGCPPPPVPTPTSTPITTPTSTPVSTPVPVSVPVSTPVPSTTPVSTPVTVPVPTTPVSTPSPTPVPVSVPQTTPSPSPVPTSTPVPTSQPVSTPVPVSTPIGPTPTSTPISTPTSVTPQSTPVPVSTPIVAPAPNSPAPVPVTQPISNPPAPANAPSTNTPTPTPSTGAPTTTPSSVPSSTPPTGTPTSTPTSPPHTGTPSSTPPSSVPSSTPTSAPSSSPTPTPTPTPIAVSTPTGAAPANTSPFLISVGLIAALALWI